MSNRRPIVGIPADRRPIGAHAFQAVGEKYVDAIARAADAVPLLIPVLPEPLDVAELLESVDGILLTGSPSNVEPHYYGGDPSRAGTLHDPERDATTLSIAPRAVAAGVPLLGLCRGFQEMNVAWGGSLWQHVEEVPGHFDHREDPQQPLDVQYGPAHDVELAHGGLFWQLAGGAQRLRVNSLHSQGVRELAPGLLVEARATDGLVEAFRVAHASAFAVGVQWHPEWRVMTNDFSRALFAAFGASCREAAARRARC